MSLIFIFSIIRTLDYPDTWLSGLFTEVPTSPDNRGSTVLLLPSLLSLSIPLLFSLQLPLLLSLSLELLLYHYHCCCYYLNYCHYYCKNHIIINIIIDIFIIIDLSYLLSLSLLPLLPWLSHFKFTIRKASVCLRCSRLTFVELC